MSTFASLGLLILRVAASGFMMTHGWGKLSGFSEMSETFPDPLGVGSQVSLILTIGAEFFCSIFVAIGLLTRLSCLPLVTTMGVAAFVIHSADPLQKKELALVYLAVFAAIFFTGGGVFSLDEMLKRRRDAKREEA